jgi:hypothetical protein
MGRKRDELKISQISSREVRRYQSKISNTSKRVENKI